MIVDIIVGATYGNEGKSKFARYYSDTIVKYVGVIKIGGYCTNNFYDWRSDSIMTNHMLPASTGYKDEMYFIFPRGSFIDVDLLKKEVEMRKIPNDKVIIDNRAYVYLNGLQDYLGFAETQKIDVGVTTDVNQFLLEWDPSSRFLVEGQGGYGLAKEIYNEYYKTMPMLPPTMTASGIVSLLNIAPTDVDDVILVTRLESERKEVIPSTNDIWKSIMSGSYEYDNLVANILSPEMEPYNISLVREAIIANDPSILVLNHLDTVESNQEDPSIFTDRQYDVLGWIERELGVNIDYVGYGKKEISELINSESENSEFDDAVTQFNDLLKEENIVNFLNSIGAKEGELIPNNLFLQLMNLPKNNQVMLPPSKIAKMKEENNA